MQLREHFTAFQPEVTWMLNDRQDGGDDELLCNRPLFRLALEADSFPADLRELADMIVVELEDHRSTQNESSQAEIQSCWRLARHSFERAVNAENGPPPKPLRGVYEWLKIHDSDDYDLPAFDTWAKYVRRCNQAVDGKKNSSRSARKGRSIAPVRSK
jgi:hypothetical protein